MRPLLGDKPAIAATGLALIKRPLLLKLLLRLAGLHKTAIAFDKTPGWPALIKRPIALPALDKNGSAWPLINSLYGAT